MNTQLVLLIVSVPPNPSSLRVRVWRRLRAIGAVALKRTVYRLPDIPDHYEHFQWLAQEIQRAGGEATLLPVEQIASGSSIPTRRSCLRTRGSFHGRNPVRHALRRAQPRRGRLHVRDASQADPAPGSPPHATRGNRARSGPSRREVPARRGARDRSRDWRAPRGACG